MQPIDVPPDDLATVIAVLEAHVPDVEVRAFGSRVRFTARETSDLDLVLMTDRPLGPEQLEALRDAFSESSLPFRVDVIDWSDTGERWRHVIERESILLRTRPRAVRLRPPWPRVQVADLIARRALRVDAGLRARGDQLSDEGVPLARPHNVMAGFDFADAERLPLADVERFEDLLSRPGDVVFVNHDATRRVAFVSPRVERFVYSARLCLWRCLQPAEIDPRWLFYWMHSREFRAQCASVAVQTETTEYVALTDQRRMHLTLPPLGEQRAVAAVLAAFDERIASNARVSATLEATTQALFKSWFRDFDPMRIRGDRRAAGVPSDVVALFPDRFEDSPLGPIPAGWPVVPRANLARLELGGVLTAPTAGRMERDDTRVVVPPLRLRRRFAEHVQPMRARQAQAETESRILAATRDALLAGLVSGEIRVPGLDPSA